MTSQWGRLRKAATEAGRDHADGGSNRRAEFASRGSDVRDAYDKGFTNRQQEQAQEAQREEHPLRQISREASNLGLAGGDSATHEIASLIERLADYLVEKEEGRHG